MKPDWWLTKDGDLDCLEMYERHYSAHRYRDGRKRVLFVGPGEKIVLRTLNAEAMFVWRKFKSDDAQTGVCCAVFRNESYPVRSSFLIEQADAIADFCWPGERHYTYINPEAVKSRNPGYCFLRAGWQRCGTSKGGLVILERKLAAKLDGNQEVSRFQRGSRPCKTFIHRFDSDPRLQFTQALTLLFSSRTSAILPVFPHDLRATSPARKIASKGEALAKLRPEVGRRLGRTFPKSWTVALLPLLLTGCNPDRTVSEVGR